MRFPVYDNCPYNNIYRGKKKNKRGLYRDTGKSKWENQNFGKKNKISGRENEKTI